MVTRNHYKRGTYLFAIFCLLIFISCFRKDTVGGDLTNYIPLFESAKDYSWGEYLQLPKYGFIYLGFNKLLCSISCQYTILLIGTSLFNLISIAIFIKRYAEIPWLSVLIYITLGLYTNTFNSVRSSMALAILLYSIPAIIDRKFIKFLLIYFLAFIVHKSVFPFIITYFLYNNRLPLKIIIPISFFIFIVAAKLSPIMHTILALYNPAYLNSETSGGGYSYYVMLIAIALFSHILIPKKKINILFFNMLLIGLCIQPFASQISYINRIVSLFTIVIIILIPNAIATIKKQDMRFLVECFLVSCFLVYFDKVIMEINPISQSNFQAVVPYLFSWQ